MCCFRVELSSLKVEVNQHGDRGEYDGREWHGRRYATRTSKAIQHPCCFTDTRGNNVFAQEDADADDLNGLRPDGGSALEFLTALDFQSPPRDYVEASVANLFYWTNILHDIFYQYGFDEAAGNFQVNNYGKGGLGGDSVHADVHDGSDTNNATMFTPKDGMSPILQTYLWTAGPSTLDVTTPHSSVGSYAAGNVALGTWAGEISGNVVLALDDANPSGPSTTDACTVIANVAAISGNIALVDRGTCTFEEKIANAQTAGASGIIIANNLDDTLFEAVGSDPAVSIPALFVGQSDGATLKSDLANGLSVTMEAAAQRDSAFENAIIAHEYAHGLTNRLTGGASNVGCLFNVQSRGLSEGWSDWFGIVLTATENDSPIIPRPFSAYVNFDPVDGPGIRNYPFSRDLGVSPLTFGQMQNLNRPHGIGEIWASVLWDLYWNMVDEYGFDSDFYHGTGGNNLLIQLVIDALKLQPCSPTFIEARDSLLTADLMNNGGANQCLIWEAAARRGVGQSAFTISSQVVVGIEAFDEPAICAAECGNNIIDAGEQCDDGNNAPFDGCAANCRLETPLEPLTGTAIGGSLVLSIAGVEVNIGTTAGQSAESVASALTDAVNNSTALQAVSSVAVSDQGKVVVTGEVTNFLIADIGLSNQANVKQVPVAWFWQLFAVLCLLSVALHALSKHSNARRHVK
ncbi:MAG: M36 family metallopeptidase [Pseudomonadota bacterium]